METQLALTHPHANTSKADSLLKKLNQFKARARDELTQHIKRLEKRRQQARYRLGQAVLDDPEILVSVTALLPENVKVHAQNYSTDGQEIARLRSQMPK